MALNPLYFVTGDLEEFFIDKDSALPLAQGTLTFYRDVSRSTPKLVYQLSGSPPNYTYSAMPNPVILSGVGTVQNATADNEVIYYYPYDASGNLDLYYVVCRNSSGVEQFSREAWPNVTSATNPTQNQFLSENQLANPQFTQVFINQNVPIVYAVAAASNQVFSFAPNWDFIISGTGTVTVSRVAIAGNSNVITSPPYVIDVTVSAGVTLCNLRQRLFNNSGLWGSTSTNQIFLAGAAVAQNQVGGTSGIQMFYSPSSGGAPIVILSGSFDNSGYALLTGSTTAPLPLSTDTNTGTAGYVDIYISFLLGSHIRISSLQVLPTTNQAGPNTVQYDLNSSNREQALMGDYYIPRLNRRPAASLLTAWDFTANPFQFGVNGTITNTAAYICDQTIGFAGATGNVSFAIDGVTRGLALHTLGTNDAFYLMQYLSVNDAKKILGTMMSVNVFGYVTNAVNPVTMQVYLLRAPSTSTIPTLPTSIGTVATNGVFTLTAAGWTVIPRSGLDTPTATMPVTTSYTTFNNLSNDVPFTGWQITDSTQISDTNYFAIVVTFAYVDVGTLMTINSISVTPSAIPSRPAPKSFNEVLRQCQYYYETSYDTGVTPGTASTNGAVIVEQGFGIAGGTLNALPLYIPVRYQTPKRIPVTSTFYATDGTAANLTFVFYSGTNTLGSSNVAVAGNWTVVNSGCDAIALNPVSRSSTLASQVGVIGSSEVVTKFQFVSDARLGIV
jgi:hypothetical protein